MKSMAMTKESRSLLYESLINVQSLMPGFTSRRIATGSRCSNRSRITSSVNPNCRQVAAQIILLRIEASSMKGRM